MSMDFSREFHILSQFKTIFKINSFSHLKLTKIDSKTVNRDRYKTYNTCVLDQ